MRKYVGRWLKVGQMHSEFLRQVTQNYSTNHDHLFFEKNSELGMRVEGICLLNDKF